MKILAVRLREVGPFIDGVALEGLSGGLDVLAGPNELGKSTLFRALHTVFFESHATAHRDVEKLRPYSGGAPMIEADFATADGQWRIRKQYLSGRMASLIDLTSGRIAARGKDAEKQLTALIGHDESKRGDCGRFSLLWVAQMAALDELAADGSAASALHAAIAREVDVVAGSARAREIRERVQTELGELLTLKSARPTGAYAAAREDHQRLLAELELAEASEHQAQERVSRLERLRERRNALIDPASVARLNDCVANARNEFEAGKAAAHALQLATHRLQSCEQAGVSVRQQFNDFDRAVREENALALAVSEAEAGFAAATRIASAASELRDELHAAAASARRSERRERRARLRAAMAELSALEIEQQNLERQRHIAAVTPQLLAKIDAEERAIVELETRLSVAAPLIRFDYEAGRSHGFEVAGRKVEAGAELRAVEPVVIEIAGVGRITVASGSFADRDDMVLDLAAHKQELAVVLANVGADTVSAAHQQAEARRSLEEHLRTVAAKRQLLAPSGLSRLKDEIARLDGEIARDGGALEEAGSKAGDARAFRPIDESELRQAQANAETALAEVARLKTVIEHHRLSLAGLAERLPIAEMRGLQRGEIAKQLADAEAATNEASRAKTAWAEKAPDRDRLGALEAALAQAETSQQGRARDLHQLELEIRGEEAALEQAGEAGTGLRRLELEGDVARSAERVAGYEAEAAMLTQLKQALDAAAEEVRGQYLKPVEERLDPYLKLVFPASRLKFGASFSAEGLVRSAADEALGALSIGTREQLAILVRLGFGKLFSEAGNPTPVILDDALAYSDDDRIGKLFAALRLASSSHQVIVLTCRTAAFASLGGRRLSLVPWHPLASAA